jgi:pimeloyl-ACP methyl ester carboxylesterase
VAFACEIARRHFRHDGSRSQGVARRQLYRTIADGFVLVDATRCGGAWRPLRIFRDLFAAGLRNREAIERAAIQVEHIDGPILLVSGGDDHVWPAAEMSEAIVARLKQRAFGHPVEHRNYPHAGHVLRYPYLPTTVRRSQNRHLRNARFSFGGNAPANAEAQSDSWSHTIAFLRSYL